MALKKAPMIDFYSVKNTNQRDFDRTVMLGILGIIVAIPVLFIALTTLGYGLLGVLGAVIGGLIGLAAPMFWYNWFLGQSVKRGSKAYDELARLQTQRFKEELQPRIDALQRKMKP